MFTFFSFLMGAGCFCIHSHSKIPKDRNSVVLDADIEGPKYIEITYPRQNSPYLRNVDVATTDSCRQCCCMCHSGIRLKPVVSLYTP
jgi:hypothetical protein